MEHEATAPELASSELKNTLAEAQATAREQLIAAWQLHIDRVREQLETGWRDQMEYIFEQRFAELQAHVHLEVENRTQEKVGALLDVHSEQAREHARTEFEQQLEHMKAELEANLHESLERAREEERNSATQQIEEARQQERAAAADDKERAAEESRRRGERQITDQLNEAARRLRVSDSRESWISTFLEAASNFCARAALFQVNGKSLKFEGGLGIGEDREAEFTLDSAPAFANAIESKDTVIAAATRGELSDAVFDLAGPREDQKAYLFPMVFRREVVGVLYAEPREDGINVSALELVTTLAVQSIAEDEVITVQPELVNISGVNLPAPAMGQWSPVPNEDQQVHLKAQRFARNEVAKLVLYKVDKVKAGRANKNLYATLKEEIDAGRDAFRQQFLQACPSMVDYYHLELVSSLARNDNTLLGPDYPGPLP